MIKLSFFPIIGKNAGIFYIDPPLPPHKTWVPIRKYIEVENEIFFLSNIMKGLSRYLYLEFE